MNRPRIVYASFDEVPGPKGASTHIDAFVRALGARFGDVWLVTPGPEDLSPRAYAPGVVQRVLGCPGDNPIGRARTMRAKLTAWLRRESFDIVHFRSPLEGMPLIDPTVRRGARVIYEVNGFPSIELKYHYRKVAIDDELPAKLRAQENACLAAADRVLTVSHVNRQAIVERGIAESKVSVIPNGVDIERFPFQPPPSRGDGPLRVVYVGTLTIWQGVESLIEAIELARKHVPVELRLIGAGSRRRRDDLDRLVRHLRLEECVEFLPGAEQSEVVRQLHASHAAAVPLLPVDRNTRQGCCPLKLLEAMSAGCPVVASDLPVVRELAEPETQFLPAHAGDARSVKNALVRLALEPELGARLAHAARQHVTTHFTWTHATNRLVTEYESLGSRT